MKGGDKMPPKVNLLGQRYGRLTVIKEAGRSNAGKVMWLCKCDCGKDVVICQNNFKKQQVSCGCYNRERVIASNTKHDLWNTRLHSIWANIKSRCHNSNLPDYKNYGGRGIEICNEWINDFKAFYDWAMQNGYADNLTIDRIDVNGNYCPENCRWVSRETQAKNKRTNRYLTWNGKTQTITAWAKEVHLSHASIAYRLDKLGWDIEKSLNFPATRGKGIKYGSKMLGNRE